MRALDHFGALGHDDPEHAWRLFNEECDWLAPFFASAEETRETHEASTGTEYAMGSPVEGGHQLNGMWSSPRQNIRVGDWTVVRALVPSPDAPDEPPVPYFHAVHMKQWRSPHEVKEGDGAPHGALVDEFVPAGLVSPVTVRDRAERWSGDAMFVGGVSLSLGVAAAALELAKGSGSFDSAEGRARDDLFLLEQQFADVELAILDASRLRTAAEDYDRASRPDESDSRRKELAEVMRSAASITQIVTAFAYEFTLDSDGAAAREEMIPLISAAAPALQNSRFMGEFLELAAGIA
jgi:hypothetical protein